MITLKPSSVRRVAKNHLGRDFVIGDLHGAFDQMWQGMKAVDFDREIDRIFSVGDLIDRGPDSARCLGFLQQPYIYAIRGNHEQNFIDLFENGPPHPVALQYFMRMYSAQWISNVKQAQIDEIISAFKSLPMVMEVETDRGLVGLVHGEVPIGMTWLDFISAIEIGIPKVIQSALEGRHRINTHDNTGVVGIDRLFVGHTPQAGGAKRFGNVFAVDTGAIFKPLMGKEHYGLTMANLNARTDVLIRPRPGGVPSVMVTEEVSEEKFGSYSSYSSQ